MKNKAWVLFKININSGPSMLNLGTIGYYVIIEAVLLHTKAGTIAPAFVELDILLLPGCSWPAVVILLCSVII